VTREQLRGAGRTSAGRALDRRELAVEPFHRLIQSEPRRPWILHRQPTQRAHLDPNALQTPPLRLERVRRPARQRVETDTPPKEPPPVDSDHGRAEPCPLTSLQRGNVDVVDEGDYAPRAVTPGFSAMRAIAAGMIPFP